MTPVAALVAVGVLALLLLVGILDYRRICRRAEAGRRR